MSYIVYMVFKCYKCGEVKPKDEFANDKSRSTGITSKCRKCHHKYMGDLRKNPQYKIIQNQKRRIRHIVKTKGFNKTIPFNEIFKTDVKGLVIYLESLFKENMNWDNYGEWEVDHIIPLETVNTFEDLINLSVYTNLQPLWYDEHKKKTLSDRTSTN
jgi:hypothetical protein